MRGGWGVGSLVECHDDIGLGRAVPRRARRRRRRRQRRWHVWKRRALLGFGRDSWLADPHGETIEHSKVAAGE